MPFVFLRYHDGQNCLYNWHHSLKHKILSFHWTLSHESRRAVPVLHLLQHLGEQALNHAWGSTAELALNMEFVGELVPRV